MPSSKPSRRRLGREALRAWYAPRGDGYPWRGSHDPYAIWVSEVMLQQTQASRVVPAFGSFLRRFPTVRALAAAHRSDVVREWAAASARTVGKRRRNDPNAGTTRLAWVCWSITSETQIAYGSRVPLHG